MTTLLSPKRSLAGRFKSGAKDSWMLLRSPDSLYLGLKRKWLVPALVCLSLFLVPTVLLPSADLVLEKLYPPVEKEHLFGIITTSDEDHRLAVRKEQSVYLVWGLAGVGVVVGLLFYAPVVRFAADAEKERLLRSLQEANGQSAAPNLEQRYRIDGEIGSGAMGVVYSAFDRTLERQVALKELPTHFVRDPERRERFRREALTLAKLTHAGIVQIYDLLDDGQRMILVMELVRGGTLEERIAADAPLPSAEAVRLLDTLCETFAYLSGKGVVHRDLKPANILCDEQGRLKVTDFGLARLLQESGMTLDGSVMGSPQYMAPEQAAGRPTDFRADVYALGIIFFELLTGRPPFTGEPAAVLLKQVSADPEEFRSQLTGVDSGVAELLLEMLHKDPDRRLCDFKAIRSRLAAVAATV